MDARFASLLHDIDSAALGSRIRAARLAAQLTQAELAAPDVTISYVSRIESGQRRPDGQLLEKFAGRLRTTVEDLLISPDDFDERATRLEVDFAELALESGDATAASKRLADLLRNLAPEDAIFRRATFLHARSLEATGDIDGAIGAWEKLLAEPSPEWAMACGIALSRCYRETGDLGAAIAVGERLLASLGDLKLDGSDEAVQLAVTVAAAYFEQGDTHHAVRLCRNATEAAEATGSPRARASAYWNASLIEAERGSLASAVAMAGKALALFGEGQDARNLARLRSQLGIMQMQLDPPALEEASKNLQAAAEAMANSSATRIDIVRNQVALARSQYLLGDITRARRAAHQGFIDSIDVAPMLAADARALEGQAAVAEGDSTAGRDLFMEAVHILTGVGADREAAQLWLELGNLLESVGEVEAARDAYRSAAVSSGLRARQTLSVRAMT
jgi:transcriptional regulator with XRE-family HTH domain